MINQRIDYVDYIPICDICGCYAEYTWCVLPTINPQWKKCFNDGGRLRHSLYFCSPLLNVSVLCPTCDYKRRVGSIDTKCLNPYFEFFQDQSNVQLLYYHRKQIKKLDNQEFRIFINLRMNFDLPEPQIYKLRLWFDLIDKEPPL